MRSEYFIIIDFNYLFHGMRGVLIVHCSAFNESLERRFNFYCPVKAYTCQLSIIALWKIHDFVIYTQLIVSLLSNTFVIDGNQKPGKCHNNQFE